MTAIYVVPRICARYCIARSIYIGHVWQLVMMIVLSLPWANRSRIGFPVCIAIGQIGLCLSVNPNQNRSSSIGRMHTKNGTSALTGFSRVLFSAGEAAGPLVAILALYPIGTVRDPTAPRIGTMLPYMMTAAVHALVLVIYAALRISPHADPAMPQPALQATVSTSTAAAAADPKQPGTNST